MAKLNFKHFSKYTGISRQKKETGEMCIRDRSKEEADTLRTRYSDIFERARAKKEEMFDTCLLYTSRCV